MNARISIAHRTATAALIALMATMPAAAGDGSGSTFTIELQLASLPQALRLCEEPGNRIFLYAWLEGFSVPEYEFRVEGNALSIYITSAAPVLPCSTETVPTATALSASAGLRTTGSAVPATLSIDYERATLGVSIDATHIAPADLAGVYRVSTLGIYEIINGGGTTEVRDFAPDLAFPAQGQGEFSVVDATADFVPAAATSFPPPSWVEAHGILDLTGVTIRLQPNATVAEPGAIGPAMTGSWMDPAQSGHGLMLQVLDDQRLLAIWFSYTPDGTQQAWFIGVGTYDGTTATITDVVRPQGGRWIPNFDAEQVQLRPWGRLTITFSDCNHGRVHFETPSEFGVGDMELTRLTLPAGLSCP